MPAQRYSVVFYDATSGKILHGHTREVSDGSPAPSQEDLEQEALQLAAQRVKKVDLSKALLLHVGTAAIDPNLPYRIDVKAKKLVQA